MSSGQAIAKFDRWLVRSAAGRLYGLLASVPAAMLLNTPAFKLHEELVLRPDNRVLDIGCGRGSLLKVLADRVAFERPPAGIDVSRAMLSMADARAHGIELVQASADSVPFGSEAFDVVTSSYVLQHLDDEAMLACLREVRRVLTPGGIAVVWEFAPTRSATLNAWHERVLGLPSGEVRLRNYTTLSAYALEAGFEWVSNAHLRPFLFPPIPRVSLIIGKAPVGWTSDVPAVNEALKAGQLR